MTPPLTRVNQMRPLSPVIRIKGNQRWPLTVFDHTFDVRKGVFSCRVGTTLRGGQPREPKNKIQWAFSTNYSEFLKLFKNLH